MKMDYAFCLLGILGKCNIQRRKNTLSMYHYFNELYIFLLFGKIYYLLTPKL